MPVSTHTVIDAAGVDPATNSVVLTMYEERPWDDTILQLRDLEQKVNNYMGYVLCGQMAETADYRDRTVRFEYHCRFRPPDSCGRVFRAVKDHLRQHQIDWRAYVGFDRSEPLRW